MPSKNLLFFLALMSKNLTCRFLETEFESAYVIPLLELVTEKELRGDAR